VGLAVYNGERHIAKAIDSILAQTYENFELIISDNASTDRTGDICQMYAEHDLRVRYYRQRVNVGAASNFNRVFELNQGSKYFKWAAHDDWIEPAFLEACVDVLERQRDVVLCQSLVEQVDVAGQPYSDGHAFFRAYDVTATGTDSPCTLNRFLARLKERRGIGLYGVIRTNVLASTGLMGAHHYGDFVLLLELAFCGPFAMVPQSLFYNRHHNENFSRQYRVRRESESSSNRRKELAWWSGSDIAKRPFGQSCKTWIMYGDLLRVIRRRVVSRPERIRYYGYLIRSLTWRPLSLDPWPIWVELILDLIIAIHPRAFQVLKRLKRRLEV
jgi:glycosyltransferase involved in cell wall biosynthesis